MFLKMFLMTTCHKNCHNFFHASSMITGMEMSIYQLITFSRPLLSGLKMSTTVRLVANNNVLPVLQIRGQDMSNCVNFPRISSINVCGRVIFSHHICISVAFSA